MLFLMLRYASLLARVYGSILVIWLSVMVSEKVC